MSAAVLSSNVWSRSFAIGWPSAMTSSQILPRSVRIDFSSAGQATSVGSERPAASCDLMGPAGAAAPRAGLLPLFVATEALGPDDPIKSQLAGRHVRRDH